MKKSILVLIGIVATFGLGIQNAAACSCALSSGSEYYDMADKVFAGEVTKISTSDGSIFNPMTTVGDRNIEVTLNVEEEFKNTKSDTFTVKTADNSAACGVTFDKGEKYLIFASKTDDGDYRVSLCNGTRNLEQSGDLIEDFTQEENPTYDSYDVFIAVEGNKCSMYSDGCNTIGLENGIPTTTTLAYCVDHIPTYTCKDYKDTTKDPVMCTAHYEPVCGVDGKTYGNSCIANTKKIQIDYEGVCKIDTQGGDYACTQEYVPVCGVDGKTYGNACHANNVEIAYEGECKTDIKKVFKTKAHEIKYTKALNLQEKQLQYLTKDTQEYLLNALIHKTRKYMEKLTTDQEFIAKFQDPEYRFRLLEYIEMRLVKMQDNIKVKGSVESCDTASANAQCER